MCAIAIRGPSGAKLTADLLVGTQGETLGVEAAHSDKSVGVGCWS
jgi:hypothetical protein